MICSCISLAYAAQANCPTTLSLPVMATLPPKFSKAMVHNFSFKNGEAIVHEQVGAVPAVPEGYMLVQHSKNFTSRRTVPLTIGKGLCQDSRSVAP